MKVDTNIATRKMQAALRWVGNALGMRLWDQVWLLLLLF